jgi:hypothetical protein
MPTWIKAYAVVLAFGVLVAGALFADGRMMRPEGYVILPAAVILVGVALWFFLGRKAE